MASLYKKKGSAKIWIRYKSGDGKWKGKPTRFMWSNAGDRRQAELLARRQGEVEAARRPAQGELLGEWVLPWILAKYEGRATTTPDRYKRLWRNVSRFLEARDLRTASQIRREHGAEYLAWRLETAARNSAIAELKFLAMVLGEAEARGYIADNPLRRLGMRKEQAKEKAIWSDKDIRKAQAHFERERSHWMLCVFYLGLYQACRLRQCALPLRAIRLDLGIIQYPAEIVKGLDGFAQPIDARFRPILQRLMAQAEGDRLCEVPWDASIRLRRSFDRAGLPDHCHHGLRATWITRAAERGVPESQAMAFCHHSSREVHRVYKRLSAVGIVHVPAMLDLPDFCVSAEAEDSGGTSPGNARASSTGQTRTGSRGPRRRRPSTGSGGEIPPTP